MTTRILSWAANTDCTFVLFLHIFDCWPLGFAALKAKNNIIIKDMPENCAWTLFPSEKTVKMGEFTYQGIFNKRVKKSILIIGNFTGPFK